MVALCKNAVPAGAFAANADGALAVETRIHAPVSPVMGIRFFHGAIDSLKPVRLPVRVAMTTDQPSCVPRWRDVWQNGCQLTPGGRPGLLKSTIASPMWEYLSSHGSQRHAYGETDKPLPASTG